MNRLNYVNYRLKCAEGESPVNAALSLFGKKKKSKDGDSGSSSSSSSSDPLATATGIPFLSNVLGWFDGDASLKSTKSRSGKRYYVDPLSVFKKRDPKFSLNKDSFKPFEKLTSDLGVDLPDSRKKVSIMSLLSGQAFSRDPKDRFLAKVVPSILSSSKQDSKGNTIQLNINPGDTVMASRELGAYANSGKGKKWYSKMLNMPVLSHLKALMGERNANKKSWDMINAAYANDPELIKQFGEARGKALSKAYMNSLVQHGVPLAAGVGSGLYGMSVAAKKNKKDSDAYNELINSEIFKSLPPEFQKDILTNPKWKKRNRSAIGKFMRQLKYGVGYGLGGNAIAELGVNNFAMPRLTDRLNKYLTSDEYKNRLSDINTRILNYNPYL